MLFAGANYRGLPQTAGEHGGLAAVTWFWLVWPELSKLQHGACCPVVSPCRPSAPDTPTAPSIPTCLNKHLHILSSLHCSRSQIRLILVQCLNASQWRGKLCTLTLALTLTLLTLTLPYPVPLHPNRQWSGQFPPTCLIIYPLLPHKANIYTSKLSTQQQHHFANSPTWHTDRGRMHALIHTTSLSF